MGTKKERMFLIIGMFSLLMILGCKPDSGGDDKVSHYENLTSNFSLVGSGEYWEEYCRKINRSCWVEERYVYNETGNLTLRNETVCGGNIQCKRLVYSPEPEVDLYIHIDMGKIPYNITTVMGEYGVHTIQVRECLENDTWCENLIKMAELLMNRTLTEWQNQTRPVFYVNYSEVEE